MPYKHLNHQREIALVNALQYDDLRNNNFDRLKAAEKLRLLFRYYEARQDYYDEKARQVENDLKLRGIVKKSLNLKESYLKRAEISKKYVQGLGYLIQKYSLAREDSRQAVSLAKERVAFLNNPQKNRRIKEAHVADLIANEEVAVLDYASMMLQIYKEIVKGADLPAIFDEKKALSWQVWLESKVDELEKIEDDDEDKKL